MAFKQGDWVRTKPMQVKSIDINNDIWVRDWDNKERRWSADELDLILVPFLTAEHTQGRDWQEIEKLLPEIDDRLSQYSCACSKSCETGEYAEPCHHYKTTQLRARLRAAMGKAAPSHLI